MTLSYACGTAALPLTADTVGRSLQVTTARYPDVEALVSVHQGIRWSYREFNARVDALADGLLRAGVRKSERVGLWSPNRAEWALVQYATAKVGAILVNINPSYRASELHYALRQSGCRFLIAAQGFHEVDCAGLLAGIRNELPALEQVVFFDTPEWAQLAQPAALGRQSEAVAKRMRELDCDEPINIQYTSGTTGFPKGATLTHHNIVNNGRLLADLLRYLPGDRICIPVPLFHCFGMVMGNLCATQCGATMIYPSESFDAEATLRAVQDERCTSLYGVPTMFIAQLQHPSFDDFDLSSLRTGVMAGAPCPVDVMHEVDGRMGIRDMSIAFGMTETSPVTTAVRVEEPLEIRCGTVGTVMPHTEVKIVDPLTGHIQPCGTPGEIHARGYAVMRGYWDDEDRTAETIDAAGWIHTGDVATMDELGYIRVIGRITDLIIRGGENIYPREIEGLLYGHPAVADVQVIGVPDEKYGEQVMAWIVVADGASVTDDEIREFCRERLAHFKIPHYVKFVDTFPMTPSGKVQKLVMQQQAIAELHLEGVAQITTT